MAILHGMPPQSIQATYIKESSKIDSKTELFCTDKCNEMQNGLVFLWYQVFSL